MTTLLAATRPTRRDAIKHPWRSIAAILLVAVPMFLVSFFLTEGNSIGDSNFPGSQVLAQHDGDDAYALLEENLPEHLSAELNIRGIVEVSHGDETIQTTVIQSPRFHQVAVPRTELFDLNAGVGDTIEIFGTQVEVQALSPGTIVVPEGTLFSPENFQTTDDFSGTWHISGKFTEEDRAALEAVGFYVYGYSSGFNPSISVSEIPGYLTGFLTFTILAIVALMLISPVFTISASQQTRNFALLASQGATPRHIRWAVLVYGVFAGFIGASIGLVLGLTAVFGRWTYLYPDFALTVPWLILVEFWALAIVASTVAAYLPALFISKSSIVDGIHGGVSDKIVRWSPRMLIGPIVLVVAVVLSFVVGGEWGDVVKQACFLAAVVALPASVPAVLWALGRLPGLTFKLATRDMLRRAMHSIPAIGALAAVIMLGTFLHTTEIADRNSAEEAYASVYPEAVFVRGDTQIPGLMGEKIDVFGSKGGFGLYSLNGNSYPNQYVQGLSESFGAIVIATPEILDMFGITEEADIYAPSTHDSGIQEFRTYPGDESHSFETASVLPALYSSFLISPEASASLGGQAEFLGTIVFPDELDDATIQAIKKSRDAWIAAPHHFESAPYILALPVIVIIVISLVLVLSNRKHQHDTLVAVGADPGTIRKVNALNAALLALVGSVMGIVSGWIAALLSGTTDQVVDGTVLEYGTLEHMMLPWPLLVSLLVVAPLVCAVIGAIASPSGRHQEASI